MGVFQFYVWAINTYRSHHKDLVLEEVNEIHSKSLNKKQIDKIKGQRISKV